jgi:hypothetical protein
LNCDLTSWPALASMDDDFHFTARMGRNMHFESSRLLRSTGASRSSPTAGRSFTSFSCRTNRRTRRAMR